MFPFFLDKEKEQELVDVPNTANEDIIKTNDITEKTNIDIEAKELLVITSDDKKVEEIIVDDDNNNPGDDITTGKIDNNAGSEDNLVIPGIPDANSTETSLSKDRFLIIAGSFSKESNAKRLVNQLKNQGFDAVIADTSKNGMLRVAMMKLNNRQIALENLLAIRNENNPDAWLLIK